jgi:hypothetical protein
MRYVLDILSLALFCSLRYMTRDKLSLAPLGSPVNRRTHCPTLAAFLALTGILLLNCGGGGSGGSPAPAISVSVSPGSASVLTGQSAQFTALVSGTSNKAVTWSVNGIVGGNASTGTIESSGRYTAPLVPPSPNDVTVKAASTVDPARAGAAVVTILNPAPSLSGISPSVVRAGSSDTTLTMNGTGFAQQSSVRLGATVLATTFLSSARLTATIPAAQLMSGGILSVTVVTPSPGGGTSNPATLTVNQPPTVTSASSVTFTVGTAGSFTVTATGFPSPTLSESGSLPRGVTFNASTGFLSGAPAAETGGTYSITFTASNSVSPNATQGFTLTVNQPPAITSASSAAFTTGLAGSFTVTATGFPAPTLSRTGSLPGGVTFNAGTGLLSGTPAAGTGGTYPIIVMASNGVGADATQNFTLTVNNPVPVVASISPNVVNFGSRNTTLTITGAGFIPQSTVIIGGVTRTTTFDSSTQLRAVVPADQLASPGWLPVSVVNPSPGGGTSSPALDLEVLYIKVSPSAPTLIVNQTQPFTAAVFGSPGQPVTWWVNDVEGGDSTAGTISSTGLYIAPGAIPAPNTIIVKAVSVADPSEYGTATVTVTFPDSDNYPRSDAGSVLRPPATVLQVPEIGWKVAVLDWTARQDAYATQEDLLAVCHTLSPLGIPHIHVATVPNPSDFPFLAVAGVLDQDEVYGPNALTNTERDALATYVRNGGTLFLWLASDTGVLSRLNLSVVYTHTDPSNTFRRPLTFDLTTSDHALDYIDYNATGAVGEEAEVHWQMLYPSDGIPTLGYSSPGAGQVLATWDAGGAAVVRSDLGTASTTGRAYVFGWRLRHNLTDAEAGIVPDDSEGPPWTNTPRLGADICRLLVRGAYEGWAGTNAQVRQFAPDGPGGKKNKAALILTHDIDDITSYELTPTIAGLEAELGVKATYNFTTSPYDTGWVETFYDASGMQDIQQALDLGMDVQSHSIGHFPDFDLAPLTLASKTETAANYFPQFSTDLDQTIGMSVLGELGVTRWLLENDFGITVEGFRSGYLRWPPDLLEGLKETGYRRDSTTAAGVTRGSFPFVPFTVDDFTGVVTTYPIVEYPVAISDDHVDAPFDSAHYTQYLNEWKAVITANYCNNAPTVLLIHPVADDDNGALRRQAEQEIIEWATTTYPGLWVGDWKTFAQFWEAQGVTCARWP